MEHYTWDTLWQQDHDGYRRAYEAYYHGTDSEPDPEDYGLSEKQASEIVRQITGPPSPENPQELQDAYEEALNRGDAETAMVYMEKLAKLREDKP